MDLTKPAVLSCLIPGGDKNSLVAAWLCKSSQYRWSARCIYWWCSGVRTGVRYNRWCRV